MKLSISLFFAFFLALGCASAQEEEGFLKSENIKAQYNFSLNENRGSVVVVVRDDNHLAGQEFLVELRPNCGAENVNVNDLEALDVESACKVDVDSIAINPEKSEISVKVWGVDTKAYRKSANQQLAKATPKCSGVAKTVKFPLSRFCK